MSMLSANNLYIIRKCKYLVFRYVWSHLCLYQLATSYVLEILANHMCGMCQLGLVRGVYVHWSGVRKLV